MSRRTVHRRPVCRRAVLRASLAAVPVAVLGSALVACEDRDADLVMAEEAPVTTGLGAASPTDVSLAVVAAVFSSARTVAVASEETAEAFAAILGDARIPLLVGTTPQVAEQLERLGARTVVTAPGTDVASMAGDREVLEVDPAAADAAKTLPAVTADDRPAPLALVLDPGVPTPACAVARANATAGGARIVDCTGGDPRSTSDAVAAVREAAGEDPARGVLAVGEPCGSTETLTARLAMALTAAELPGGGQTAFTSRRMVATYGSPGIPSLGVLGEQDLEATIRRTQELAAEYEPFSDLPVIPALEIIATVASSQPGPDNDYSTTIDPATLRPWVDAAGAAGVYVVLDLQPGRTDFLTQAKVFEELLAEPHVGLALDSEWRLAPDEVHLEQIGSVTGAEINETASWLADLTRDRELPQKVLILHQFSRSMISDRQSIDTSRHELAITVHADGHGTPDLKLGTWQNLQKDLPPGIVMSWKNFYDEDTPTFTPEETYAIEPRPWFVSYQ